MTHTTGHAHTPRPTDLVALVSFDGEVYANQAVTRERLGKTSSPPHALAATIRHWLGGGRQVWIDVRGRQIQGIATARPLATAAAWEIDTLVDAGAPEDGVVTALLGQASEAAVEAGVTQLTLRLRADAPALPEALRAGFVRAMHEELWVADASEGPAQGASDGSAVRDVEDEDAFALFQLYNRALPIDARQALGLTFEEWQATQERRWLGRGARELVAAGEDAGGLSGGGRVRGMLQSSSGGQFTLLVEPGFEALASELYVAAAAEFEDAERRLALQPACAGTPGALLRSFGYQPGEEYVRLSRRTARPLMEAIPVAGRTVPTRG